MPLIRRKKSQSCKSYLMNGTKNLFEVVAKSALPVLLFIVLIPFLMSCSDIQQPDYYNGEKIKFKIKATQDCYIKVIYLSTAGKGRKTQTINTLLFPNVHDQKNKLRAGSVG